MPRQPRIEYDDAIYYVMARGNCRAPIVLDDHDRRRFVQTLSEACEKAAWEVYAWVLLDNHYHIALRTPAGNLVDGMTAEHDHIGEDGGASPNSHRSMMNLSERVS